MNILHVMWGFSSWREGGLIKYADEIMASQAALGHKVAAFFSGRRGFWGAPRLFRWTKGDVEQFEIRNAPIVHLGNRGTFPAASELGEPVSERLFEQTLAEFRPDVVHVHELAGLPFSIIDICKEQDFPLVATLHDYFLLCPTINLYDRQGAFCQDATGKGCVMCCQRGTDHGLRDRYRTFKSRNVPLWLVAAPLLLRYGWDKLLSCKDGKVADSQVEEIYRQRHQHNRERFLSFDLVLAQSSRAKEIYEERTGRKDIRVVHSSLAHIERLIPRIMDDVNIPVRFASLNGAITPHKGALLLRDCVAILKERGYESRYRLDLFGDIFREVKQAFCASPAVRWRGTYRQADLNKILADIDVGIVPSVCEEVYGYVGIEFLAKGIPVIGNRRGGIVDYTLEGYTGWLNKSSTAEELARIMIQIIDDPACIRPRNKWVVANRNQIIADRKEHIRVLMEGYAEAIAKHKGGR